jgi:hypothetical protein
VITIRKKNRTDGFMSHKLTEEVDRLYLPLGCKYEDKIAENGKKEGEATRRRQAVFWEQ